MGDEISRSTADLLREAYSPAGGPEGADNPAYTAQLALYARTQYAFYVAFQALVAVLALAVTAALVVTVLRQLDGRDASTVVAGVATLASGGATAFLQKQASDAKDRYQEAMGLLREA